MISRHTVTAQLEQTRFRPSERGPTPGDLLYCVYCIGRAALPHGESYTAPQLCGMASHTATRRWQRYQACCTYVYVYSHYSSTVCTRALCRTPTAEAVAHT